MFLLNDIAYVTSNYKNKYNNDPKDIEILTNIVILINNNREIGKLLVDIIKAIKDIFNKPQIFLINNNSNSLFHFDNNYDIMIETYKKRIQYIVDFILKRDNKQHYKDNIYKNINDICLKLYLSDIILDYIKKI